MLKAASYIVIPIYLFFSRETLAQCPTPSFTLEESVCINQNSVTINSSENATLFVWDFCSGDLASLPTGNNVLNNANFFRARSVKLIEENGLWYGFAISATANILMRLDFGNSLENSPIYIELGNVGAALSSAFNFDMIKIENYWHLLVANGEAKNILHYSFESGIEETPTLVTLNTPLVFDDAGPNAIKIIQDSDQFHAFVTKGSTVGNSKLIRLDFDGTTLSSNPNITEIAITGGNQLRGVDLIKECENWYGFVISQNTNDVYKLDFGNNIKNSLPSQIILNDLGLFNTPVSIKTINESGRFYAIIANARIDEINTAIYITDLGESLSNNDIFIEKFYGTEMLGGLYAIDLVYSQSKNYAFSFNLSTRNLLRFDFPNNCSAQQPISEESEPIISYSESGEYYVSLKATDEFGNVSYHVDTITVTSDIAPTISLNSQNVCLSEPILFTAESSSESLDYTWHFGDGDTSNEPSPSHLYSTSGEYEVLLEVNDGICSNFTEQNITVYETPTPDFTIPEGNICTNQPYIFQNLTPGEYGDLITYQWLVDNEEVGTIENLEYTFTSGGEKEVKLIATIPGCSIEQTKILTNVKEGTLPSFDFEDACIGEEVLFTNNSVGDLVTTNWDFGNGSTSTAFSPTQIFEQEGTYDVQLSLINADGCETFTSLPITIDPLPQVAFTNELACENLETVFIDQSTVSQDNLAQWNWQFGDGSVAVEQQNPAHLYQESGQYQVKLIATTTFGCVDSLTQQIEVLPAPQAAFNYDLACLEVPILFSDESAGPDNQNITNWAWDLAGNFSSEQNPTIVFSDVGDYEVNLTVTSENLCTDTFSQTITISPPPEMNISVENDCANETALLSDATSIIGDHIFSRQWLFEGNEISTSESFNKKFPQAGEYEMGLIISTEKGCEYQYVENIVISEIPKANFVTSFPFGAPPLNINFTNTSVGATTYQWQFEPEAFSEELNPTYTFENLGVFDVRLVAINAQDCSDTTSQRIEVLQPILEAELFSFTIIPSDNGDKLSLTIRNNGSIRFDSLLVKVDLGGQLAIAETIQEVIYPQEVITTQLNLQFNNRRLDYVCAQIEPFIADYQDINFENNGACINLNNADLIINQPYPNPVSDIVTFEVLSQDNTTAIIDVLDNTGKILQTQPVDIVSGPNLVTLQITSLPDGLYLVRFASPTKQKIFRLVVSN